MNQLYHKSFLVTSALTFFMYFVFLISDMPSIVTVRAHIAGYLMLIIGFVLLIVFSILKVINDSIRTNIGKNINDYQIVFTVIGILAPFLLTL
jgi:uncharacterized membrane protein